MTVIIDGGRACPACSGTLGDEAPPWCPGCEWGLGAFDERRVPRRWGVRAADRLDHWLAFRLNRRQYDSLAGRPIGHRGRPAARAGLLAVALPLALLGPVCVVGGVLVTLLAGPLALLVGVGLVAVGGVLSWPRRARAPWGEWPVPPDAAPALFELVRRVAAAAGAPVPHEVRLSHDVNAHTTLRGLRRRRLLVIGLPLWAALDGPERVALLGHELGHFVNGDNRRGLVTGAAYRTVGFLRETLAASVHGPWILFAPVLLVGGSLLWLLTLALLLLGGRDSQRAEYLADQVATRVGGSAAAARLHDTTLAIDGGLFEAMDARHLNHADPAAWRTAAAQLRATTDLAGARLRSLRLEASLLASHPPTGLRGRMVRSRPPNEPMLTLTDAEWAAVDAELAPWFARLRARVLDFRG